MKQLTKVELAKVFHKFDPQSIGIITYKVFHRALITYGENLTKEKTDRFMHIRKLKPKQPVNCNDLFDEIVKI